MNTTMESDQTQPHGVALHPRELDRYKRRPRAFVCRFLWIASLSLGLAPNSSRGTLVMDIEDGTTISPTSPSISISLHNDGSSPVAIGGFNLFVLVGGGTAGPTIDTALPVAPNPAAGVDMLNRTLFQGSPFGQFAIGTPQARDQGWGVLAFPAVSLGSGASALLGTITFSSFPAGSYGLSFEGTTFADPWGGVIEGVSLPSGNLTAVPESLATPYLAGAFGLLLLGWRLFGIPHDQATKAIREWRSKS